jgi:hypothetical protein
VLDKLRQEYMEAVEQVEGGLPDNPLATIRDGRLHLKRPDLLEAPERVKQVKRVIETSLPHVRCREALYEWNFTLASQKSEHWLSNDVG